MMMWRRAAPDWMRCTATARNLAHGETAQCMRYRDNDYLKNAVIARNLCTQHAKMLLEGKPVICHHSGQRMTLMPVRTSE